MAAWNKPVPELRGITGTPSFLSDGTLIEKKGYQAETGLFFDSAGMQLPAAPTTPSAEDLQRATHLICTEWLGDFPFQDDASRAAAIGDLVIRFYGYDSHQKGSVYSLEVAEGDGDEAAPSAAECPRSRFSCGGCGGRILLSRTQDGPHPGRTYLFGEGRW